MSEKAINWYQRNLEKEITLVIDTHFIHKQHSSDLRSLSKGVNYTKLNLLNEQAHKEMVNGKQKRVYQANAPPNPPGFLLPSSELPSSTSNG